MYMGNFFIFPVDLLLQGRETRQLSGVTAPGFNAIHTRTHTHHTHTHTTSFHAIQTQAKGRYSASEIGRKSPCIRPQAGAIVVAN